MSRHALLTGEEALVALDAIRERLGNERVLKITAAPLYAKSREGQFVDYAPDVRGEPCRRGRARAGAC